MVGVERRAGGHDLESYLPRWEGDFAEERLRRRGLRAVRDRLPDEDRSERWGARHCATAPRVGARSLGGQLGPQLLFPSQHLVAARLHGIPHTVTGTAGHLARRATHLDHEGVGLQSGRGLLDGAAHPALGPQ